jgi:acetyl esterase
VAAIDYTIAPEAKYPTPIQQLNKALEFITLNAEKFHADQFIFCAWQETRPVL